MKTKKISNKSLPTKPLGAIKTGCIAYLMMDKFNVSEIIIAIVLTFFAIVFIGGMILVAKEEHIDIFDKTNNKV